MNRQISPCKETWLISAAIGDEYREENRELAVGGFKLQPFDCQFISSKSGTCASRIFRFSRQEEDVRPYSVRIEAVLQCSATDAEAILAVGFDEFAPENNAYEEFPVMADAMLEIAAGRGEEMSRLGNFDLLAVPPECREFYLIFQVWAAHFGEVPAILRSLDVAFTELPPAATGEGTECAYWAAPRGMKHNVAELGADPTGRRDSTAAFQKALDAGGEILVPGGRYRIDRTLLIRKSHTFIRGDGMPELFRERRSEGDYSFFANLRFPAVRQLQDIRISGLALTVADWETWHLGNHSAAFALWGIRGLEISDCVIHFPAHDCIRCFCCEGLRISNCTTFGARHGITIGGNNRNHGAFDSTIIGNQVYRAWDTGIVVGIQTERTVVSNNLIAEIGCHGIDIFNCRNVTATGNLVRNWASPQSCFYDNPLLQAVGIFIHADWGLLRHIPTENVTISGNTLCCEFDYTPPPEMQQEQPYSEVPQYRSPIGIQVTGDLVRNVTLTGNTVTGGTRGFYLTDLAVFGEKKINDQLDGTPQNICCAGNSFCNQLYAGIEVDARTVPIRAQVAGNLIAGMPWKPLLTRPEAGVDVSRNQFSEPRVS